MRTLIVGDVHGCAAELKALIRLGAPDRLCLVGDLFTKGPDPLGVWRIVKRWQPQVCLGNHELRVLDQARRDGTWGPLPARALVWIRSLPLVIDGPGWRMVHAGLHPTGGVSATTQKIAVRVRRWPDDTDPRHPFWWEGYTSERLVVYGHDAIRGLQDRRPHTLGLDTGCVYGGRLTGYLVEEDRLISVPARRIYRRARGPRSAGVSDSVE